MRVLTRTFPPASNPNYGGILQAWALQQALHDLGHDPRVDSTRSSQQSALRRFLKEARHFAIDRLCPAGLVPARFVKGIAKREANRELLRFPREHIRSVALYKGGGRVSREVLDLTEAFVVGSDQIWRTSYMDVSSFLLDFLPEGRPAPRIAYAASFGVDTTEGFSPELTARTKELAQRFNAVSVREESGVAMAHELWGLQAVRVIDPTLLLSPARYETIMGEDSVHGGLASYILDASKASSALVDQAASHIGASVHHLFPPLATSLTDLRRHPERYRRPSVGDWVRTIARADAVVTDSYHGTLFSILFNKPFLVSLNAKRGATRFETILQILSLEDRIVQHDGEDLARLEAPIEWEAVNTRIAAEREQGLDFLTSALKQH